MYSDKERTTLTYIQPKKELWYYCNLIWFSDKFTWSHTPYRQFTDHAHFLNHKLILRKKLRLKFRYPRVLALLFDYSFVKFFVPNEFKRIGWIEYSSTKYCTKIGYQRYYWGTVLFYKIIQEKRALYVSLWRCQLKQDIAHTKYSPFIRTENTVIKGS